jgi:Xaa-Pro aminopeptidase
LARLRAERRRRLFDAMADADIDVLVLGRPANIQYASGAHQLWAAGLRPFAPACVVVRETGRVHLMSTWDDGVPPEIRTQDLFGMSWNPAVLIARLQAIPGLGGARRVATDGVSPAAAELLQVVCPAATLVDGVVALWQARAHKTTDELACIRTAANLAEAALSTLVAGLIPGVTERSLVGTFVASLAALGVPTPPSEGIVCATPRQGPVSRRRLAGDRPVGPGELVALNPGAFYAGYEASLARTWVAGEVSPTRAQRDVARRCREVLDAVVSACRAGARGSDLQRAWDASGEPAPPAPFVRGVGLGAEPPLIGAGLGAESRLQVGMVLAVEAWVAAEGAGGVLEQDLVLVTDAEPEVLTRYGRGPLADNGA